MVVCVFVRARARVCVCVCVRVCGGGRGVVGFGETVHSIEDAL